MKALSSLCLLLAAAPPAERQPCDALGARPAQGRAIAPGQEAPDFELADLQGTKVSLRSLRGRPVVLAFWATWCLPCKREMPALERLAKRFADRVSFLAVNVDGDRDAISQFFPRGTRLKVLLDQNQVGPRFGTEGLPETFLIDSAGRVQHLFFQAPWEKPEAAACVSSLR